MARLLFYVVRFWKENGTVVTLGVANLGLIGFCFWKLFTNHLAHIAKDIKANGKEIKKVDGVVRELGQRVSKVEGKLEK